jgi:alkylation response protein AidB-like acyl-CoA dehydrogenase
LALDEGSKHRPEAIEMRAERSGNGFSLTGRKQFVVQGASADVTLVAAQTDEGLTLFAVEKGANGLDVEGVRLADSSIGARLTFQDVTVDADAVIGEVGGAPNSWTARSTPAAPVPRPSWSASARPRWT